MRQRGLLTCASSFRNDSNILEQIDEDEDVYIGSKEANGNFDGALFNIDKQSLINYGYVSINYG